MINKKQIHMDLRADEEAVRKKYQTYYNQVLVKEQPFYHRGMTSEEAAREMDYLNGNLQAFYEGRYTPLWRQNLYK
ncbi:MAG: hypothetical protein ACI39Q_00805 [Wujia sp.]